MMCDREEYINDELGAQMFVPLVLNIISFLTTMKL